jgi:hypothetical protein
VQSSAEERLDSSSEGEASVRSRTVTEVEPRISCFRPPQSIRNFLIIFGNLCTIMFVLLATGKVLFVMVLVLLHEFRKLMRITLFVMDSSLLPIKDMMMRLLQVEAVYKLLRYGTQSTRCNAQLEVSTNAYLGTYHHCRVLGCVDGPRYIGWTARLIGSTRRGRQEVLLYTPRYRYSQKFLQN